VEERRQDRRTGCGSAAKERKKEPRAQLKGFKSCRAKRSGEKQSRRRVAWLRCKKFNGWRLFHLEKAQQRAVPLGLVVTVKAWMVRLPRLLVSVEDDQRRSLQNNNAREIK